MRWSGQGGSRGALLCFLVMLAPWPCDGRVVEQVGGVCGEIAVRDPRMYNMIESAQHFEYKLSHVMDKGAYSGQACSYPPAPTPSQKTECGEGLA